MYRVVLADDHTLIRKGIKRILTEAPEVEIVGEARDGLELLELLKTIKPDMVVLDISMPRLGGIEAAREIKKLYGTIKTVILSMHKSTDYLHQALLAGVHGYVLKEDSDTELVSAIEKIRNGETYISPILFSELKDDLIRVYRGEEPHRQSDPLPLREKEVLKLIVEGKTNKEIADLLYISIRTVQTHRFNITEKLNIKNLPELVKYAISKGYTASPDTALKK